MPEAENQKPVLVGRIGAAHGLKGQVRINSFTQDPLAIASYPLQDVSRTRTFTILSARPAKNVIIASLEGVTSREQAEVLNGTELYVTRGFLTADSPTDTDEFLHADLIGLKAISQTGDLLGQIIAIADFGAGDLLEIRPPSGQSFYLPFTHAFVPEIDMKSGHVRINMPRTVSGDAPRSHPSPHSDNSAKGPRPRKARNKQPPPS